MYTTPYEFIINLATAPLKPKYFLGGLVSGVIGAFGAKKASDQAADAERDKIREERRQFDETRKDLAPFREAGLEGFESYQDLVNRQGDYEGLIQSNLPDQFKFGAEEFEQYKDPGYEFRRSEGERALNRNFAGLGKRISGERFAGLQDYGQRLGSQEFAAARGRAASDYTNQVGLEQSAYDRSLGQYGRQYEDVLNRQANLGSIGLEASGQQIQARENATSGITSAIGATGQAQAAGTLGQFGAISSAVGDIGRQYSGLGQLPPSNRGPSPLSQYAKPASSYDWNRGQ